MRFAGQALSFPSEEVEPGIPLEGVVYPQDGAPAGFFGVDPTEIPLLRDRYMMSPEGGITRLPNFEQGPDQGPSTPIKYYPGMGYAPETA